MGNPIRKDGRPIPSRTCSGCGGYRDFRALLCRPCAFAAGHYHEWPRERCIEAMQAWAEKHGRVPTANGDWKLAGYGHPNCKVVRERFGSWRAGLRAAGLKPHRNGSKPYWTKQRIVEAMLDYMAREGRWATSYDWIRSDPQGRWPAKATVQRVCGGWIRAEVAAGRLVSAGRLRDMTRHTRKQESLAA